MTTANLSSQTTIHAQLMKVNPTRGIMVATFWQSNIVTITDAFGNCKQYTQGCVETMRHTYREMIAKGYTLVSTKK